MRHYDAERTAVQATGGEREFAGRHANQRRDSGVERRHRDRIRSFHRGWPVFQVDEQPVETRGFHHPRDLDAAHRPHADPDRNGAFREKFLGRIHYTLHALSHVLLCAVLGAQCSVLSAVDQHPTQRRRGRREKQISM
jgi:hypothetical protein